METSPVVLGITLMLSGVLHAGSRSSANYSIAADAVESGGRRATSAAYTNDGSIGGVVGFSSVVSPAETMKHGYVGQLYEVKTNLQLGATPATINEASTRQINPYHILDDDSKLAISVAAVTWSVLSGPLSSINNSGVATAGIVFQDTAASVQGVHNGNTASLGVTVLNSSPDNYGSYSGDGLDDAWQNQHFGLNNPNAAPGVDADGDGQTNLFEFTAGLVPTSNASHFSFAIQPVVGQPGQHRVVFNPLNGGSGYVVKYKNALSDASWSTLTGATISDVGQQRTVTDPNASGTKKFYTVEITKP